MTHSSLDQLLRSYFLLKLSRRYEPRGWDCAKFAICWVLRLNPLAARAAVDLLTECGYNEVPRGSQTGLDGLYEAFEETNGAEFSRALAKRLGDLYEPVTRQQPGDIVIRDKTRQFGIVDTDLQGMYLSPQRGYVKRPVGTSDGLLRVKWVQ